MSHIKPHPIISMCKLTHHGILQLTALTALAWSVVTILPGTVYAQAPRQCADTDNTICHSNSFCLGLNTGFFSYASLDRPFIDQARGSQLTVVGYSPNSVGRNPNIPLDSNHYPTETGRTVSMLFHANTSTTHTNQMLPDGQYVVLWDGAAANANIRGIGGSNITVDLTIGRIEFTFDGSIVGNTWLAYENATADNHVRNVRIVPKIYEADYANWSWDDYAVGAVANPPIFFPEWIDKMSKACTIRYMNSLNTNDPDAIQSMRDSFDSLVSFKSSVWYDGFGLEGASVNHSWPWELVIESSLQTGTTPWINFRVMTHENGSAIVSAIANLFAQYYGKQIFVEYVNEVWNTAYPFNVATNHVRVNGPGSRDNVEENYSLRNNSLQKDFAQAYGDNGCDVIGVLASQGRFPGRGAAALEFADLNYVDVLSPTTYVGDNLTPGNDLWNYVSTLLSDVERGTKTRTQAFSEIRDELLTGDNGVIDRNWENDVGPFTMEYVDMANDKGMCTAFYEAGLHMRIDGIDPSNAGHRALAQFLRDYQKSPQQAQVERKIATDLAAVSTGPNILYANFESSGWGTFSYWDSVFENFNTQASRINLFTEFNANGSPPPPPVQVSVTDTTAVESDRVATVHLVLSQASTSLVSVDVRTLGTGSAAEGEDYWGIFQTVEFAAGETTKSIQVTIIDNAVAESEESLAIRIANPRGASLSPGRSVSTLIIQDDDSGGGGGSDVLISAQSKNVGEGDGSAEVTLTLSRASNQPVTVTALTRQTGDARGGPDFWSFRRDETFVPGETSKVISIVIIDDNVAEATETFSLLLDNPRNAAISPTDAVAVVTINDDDSGGSRGATINAQDVNVGEGDGAAIIRLTLSDAQQQPVSVMIKTRQTNSARGGPDYWSFNRLVEFTPGDTTQDVSVVVIDDNIAEPAESFSLILEDPVNAELGTEVVVITINDDD